MGQVTPLADAAAECAASALDGFLAGASGSQGRRRAHEAISPLHTVVLRAVPTQADVEQVLGWVPGPSWSGALGWSSALLGR